MERECPICEKKLKYKNKYTFNNAVKKNQMCSSCSAKKRYEDVEEVEKFKKRMSKYVKDNGGSFKGRKHTKETKAKIANKISELVSGENNPMYGKPSPTGSGNGWSGWYKGWYFRSINELSYMVNVIERFELTWISAECKQFKIRYINNDGVERNYFADFIINDKYLIECKPKKLWNSENNIKKAEFANIFCEENNLKYKLRDVRRLTDDEILNL